MATPSPSNGGGRTERLNGWKEIALHFGKGVRTVQRWEKDLGLPVRRLGTGRGEIVFAFISELEAWREAAERGSELAAHPGEDDVLESSEERAETTDSAHMAAPASVSPSPADTPAVPPAVRPARRFSPAFILLVAAATVAVILIAWWAIAGRRGEPFEARIENHALRVYDENGRFLWEHRFDFPLDETPQTMAERARRGTQWVDDLDGDGHREVLLTVFEAPGTGCALFCFDDRGRLRFRHVVEHVAWYGKIPYPGPWRPILARVAADPGGAKAIWVAFVDREQFPTVVEKLSPAGKVLGQFWHAGTVDSLEAGVYQGRPVMFAGANNNESDGAALAVIDRVKPDGSNPSLTPKFTCDSCPTAPPLAYFVFPGTEIERVMQNSAAVFTLRQAPRGDVSLMVSHVFEPARLGLPGNGIAGHTSYVFTPDLRPLVAHHEPSYRLAHDEAYKMGVLDHPFSEAEDRDLKVLRWNGARFESLPVVAAR